jgi:prolyl-tRNA synthetase
VSGMLGVPPAALLKAMPVVLEGRGPALVVLRGDHRLNEIKLQNAVGAPVRPAEEREVEEAFGTMPGFIGPVGARVEVIADDALRGLAGMVAGANEPDLHLRGVEPGRDFDPAWVDVRRVEQGDTCPHGASIRIEPAIEVGNIFKLGTRYSEPLGATFLDEEGVDRHLWMGSYGIGPARIVAATIEQFADEDGIAWPRAVAPFDVELVTLGKPGEKARDVADRLYDELRGLGLEVLYDDRPASAGEKFIDAELLGCPLRVTVGRKSVEAGEADAQVRRGRHARSLPLEDAAEAAAKLWRTLP